MIKNVRLGDYVNIKTGKLDANASCNDGQYPFFTCAISPLKIDSYAYDCECVLVAGNGDLNVKYYKGKFNAYQRTYIIESSNKKILDVVYLYYYIDSYMKTLREQTIGGVIKYIKLENLTEISIPLPPLEEQNRIVEILDKANELVEKKKEQISLMDKLGKDLFIDMFGDPVTNPKGWEKEKLIELGAIGRGVSKHRPRNDNILLGGRHPLIQTGEVSQSNIFIKSFKQTYSDIGLKQSKLWNKGTLCITIAANIANTGILAFDSCFPDSIVGFVPHNQNNAIFIHFCFLFFQRIIENQASQVAQKNINLEYLKQIRFINPPMNLQNKFAERIEKIEQNKQEMQTALTELQTLRDNLMYRAFNN